MDKLPLQLNPRHRRFERMWNTYVRIPLPWKRTLGADYWEGQVEGGAHGFDKFVELQESSHVLIDEVVRYASSLNAPILDLGCNVGRHLDALHRRGFTHLYGVDIQREAIERMGEIFPDMAKSAHVEQATFQDYLPKFAEGFFEIVFTHGATVELVSPSFPICRHMARTAGRAVVMVINESGHAYPRLWEEEFLRENFLLTKLLRPSYPQKSTSLLVFQRMTI